MEVQEEAGPKEDEFERWLRKRKEQRAKANELFEEEQRKRQDSLKLRREELERRKAERKKEEEKLIAQEAEERAKHEPPSLSPSNEKAIRGILKKKTGPGDSPRSSRMVRFADEEEYLRRMLNGS
jgi:hypothetical protein